MRLAYQNFLLFREKHILFLNIQCDQKRSLALSIAIDGRWVRLELKQLLYLMASCVRNIHTKSHETLLILL